MEKLLTNKQNGFKRLYYQLNEGGFLMTKKEDRRIQKSRRTIKKAFIELLDEKGFGNMSVHDIAERADINRGTFYLHYQDKFDLFGKYVDELLSELISTLEITNREKEKIKSGKRERDSEPYVQFFKHFQDHSYFYKSMFSYKGGPYFYDRFIDVLKKHYVQGLNTLDICEGQLKTDKDLLIHFMVHAHFGVINYWLQNDMSDSPESMGKQLSVLLSSMSKVNRDQV